MRRFGILLLTLAMCLSLCACGITDTGAGDKDIAANTLPTLAPFEEEAPMPTEPAEEEAATQGTQGATEPQPTACNHNYTEATCQKPATCTICGETKGEAAAHNYNKATCTVCGAENPTYSKIAKALKDIERYPKYIEINVDLIANEYDLFNMTGDLDYFNDAHKHTLEIQGYLNKVIDKCEDYVNDDFWIKEIVEDCQECILEMPIVPTSTGKSAIRSYISDCKTYSKKADRIFAVYENLCETYGVS